MSPSKDASKKLLGILVGVIGLIPVREDRRSQKGGVFTRITDNPGEQSPRRETNEVSSSEVDLRRATLTSRSRRRWRLRQRDLIRQGLLQGQRGGRADPSEEGSPVVTMVFTADEATETWDHRWAIQVRLSLRHGLVLASRSRA